MKTEEKPFTFRIPADLLAALRAEAAASDRTVAQTLRRILRTHVEKAIGANHG